MIKTKLINEVKESKKYIALTVVLQWIRLCANIVMVFLIADVIDKCLNRQTFSVRQITLAVVLAVLILAVRYICSVLISKASYLSSANVKKSLRNKMYEKLTRLGASYHEKVSTSEVIQVFTEGVDQMELYFGKYLPQFFYSLLAPLTLFAVLCSVSLKAVVVLLVCVPLIPMSIVAVQKIAKKLLNKYWGKYVVLGDTFLENIQALTTLKVYGADERKNKEMNEKAEEFRKITMKVLTMQLNSISVMDIVAYAGSAAGVIIAVSQVAGGSITLSKAFLIIMLAADFFLPLRQLGSYFHVAMNGMAASDKLFKLLEIEEDADGTLTVDKNNTDIEIKDLSFGYNEQKKVLKNISMKIPCGSFVAVVGESGCGKSTLASLLCSVTKGYEGSITIGGKEVRNIKESSLLENITCVNFNSFVFAGTVRENLLMAKPDAKDEQLKDALKKVKLWSFLETQNGLDTVLTQKGSNFSGGQRQRLAIARALLHETGIYIFDEVTSNIDAQSEDDIMQIIRLLSKEKTVILISHRLKNVTECSQIYLLENGSILQQGTHKELCNAGGKYADMYYSQDELEQFAKEAVVI